MNILYAKIVELISLNKGVVWGNCVFHDAHFRLQFGITDSKTRLLIHFVAEASNTDLCTYAKIHPCELGPDMDPDSQLVYEYRSGKDDEISDQVCWLGAHLAWAMFKMGAISADIEQEFCRIFGACSRST